MPLKWILNYSSWKIYFRYGVNTLGPLCLWQCFIFSTLTWYVNNTIEMGETHVKVKDKTHFCPHFPQNPVLEVLKRCRHFSQHGWRRGKYSFQYGNDQGKEKEWKERRVDKSQWFPMFIAFSLSVVLMHHNLFITICISFVVGFPEEKKQLSCGENIRCFNHWR